MTTAHIVKVVLEVLAGVVVGVVVFVWVAYLVIGWLMDALWGNK